MDLSGIDHSMPPCKIFPDRQIYKAGRGAGGLGRNTASLMNSPHMLGFLKLVVKIGWAVISYGIL